MQPQVVMFRSEGSGEANRLVGTRPLLQDPVTGTFGPLSTDTRKWWRFCLTIGPLQPRITLDIAMQRISPNIVKVLVERGVDVDTRDREGMTPFHSCIPQRDAPKDQMLAREGS